MRKLFLVLVVVAFFSMVNLVYANQTDTMIERSGTSRLEMFKSTITIGAADTSGSFVLTGRGQCVTIVAKIPNWTNMVTATLTVTNQNGDEIYASAARVQNATYVTVDHIVFPVVGANTVKLTLSGAPGGSGDTATVSFYIE